MDLLMRLPLKKYFFILSALLLGLSVPVVSRAADPSPEDRRLDKLAHDLAESREYKRMLVIERLGRIGDDRSRELLLQTMLRDKARSVRLAAQRELANVRDPRIFPAIKDALLDPERRVRLAGLEAMGLVRDPQAADFILLSIQKEPEDLDLVLTALAALREFVYRTEPNPGFEKKLEFLLTFKPSWWPFRNHDRRRIQRTAVAILGILGRPDSLKALMALWPKANDRLKILLADAFANIGWEPPARLLIPALDSPNPDVGIHCLYALARIQSFAALEKIRQVLLQRNEPRLLIAGLNAFIEIQDPDNLPVILKLLDHPDATVRHWAIYTLGQLQARKAIPALEAKLGDASPLVRATAATALGELKSASSQPKLLNLLADPREPDEVRIAAAKALMRLGNPAGSGLFWGQMQRPDLPLEIRLNYALALGATRSETWRAKLAQELVNAEFGRAFCAALALGVMGDVRSENLLLKALEHGLPSIRRYAVIGLEPMTDKAVLAALADTANDDPDPVVRLLCAADLVAAGFPEFRVLLWNALDNKNEDVRSEAVIALGRTADAEILKQLKWYLRREPSVPVRETIWRVLRDARKI